MRGNNMRRNKNSKKRFKLLPGSILYFALLIFSLIFTQLLRNAASGALFIFVLLLPVISFVHCMIGRSVIQVYVMSDVQKAEKRQPLEYEIRIMNNSFLSFPFVEAVISEPGTNALKCTKKDIVLSLVPYGFYSVKNTVDFKYRGLYEIGVDSLYISDLFRFFALRADMENYTAVSVYPRRMALAGANVRFTTDVPSPKLRRDVSLEQIELSDIRDYVPGDPVRSIHWKLSSKTQDIKIRQYSSAENRHVYVFCDLAKAAEPPKKKDADDIYKSLRKTIEEESRKDKNDKLRRAITVNAEQIEAIAQADPEGKDSKKALRSEKRRNAKYKKNIKSGMNEKDAETIRSIDELISSTSKKKKKKKEEPPVPPAEQTGRTEPDGSSGTVSDLKRILELSGIPETDDDTAAKLFGGRVRDDAKEDYNEACADAVVEMTLALAESEIKSGNICTVCWYDRRADGGICSVALSGEAEFENVFTKLATAANVPEDSYVTGLSSVISESSDVKIKIVTSNIDPHSTSEIKALPSKFGGAGTGCSTELLVYSPSERYEDPTEREAYAAGICSDLVRGGIAAHRWEESTDISGSPVFVFTE